ncbi:MAG: hypothetical protein PHX30_05015 [Candidatus Pacebacteria bacterium]|jgi:Tfp pilus assembly protein PilN|nr:hypothetical protein [Candidatus Paceibacterota bacterium]
MPSINLLPENFTIEAYQRREKTAVYILAVFFILVPAMTYGVVDLERRDVEKNTVVVDSEIANVKIEIKNEIEKSDLLSSEYNKKDIEDVLGKHRYASKGMAFIKNNVIQGVYLTSLDCDPAAGSVDMEMVARDYDTLIKQLLIFEDSFWIESVDFSDIEKNKEDGSVSVGLTTVFKQEMFGFQEQYWDFGLGILSPRTNRYVEITSHSVSLQETTSATAEGGAVKKVVVSFEGKAYDKTHLDNFEKSLNDASEVEKVIINRFSLADDKPGVVDFRGNMTLNY